jgi:glutaredoxin 2
MERYTVYISNHCPGCVRVLNYLKEQDVSCKIFNIDKEEKDPPVNVFILPALMNDKDLVAYGDKNIIDALSKVKVYV